MGRNDGVVPPPVVLTSLIGCESRQEVLHCPNLHRLPPTTGEDDTLSVGAVGTPNYGSASISGATQIVYTPTNRTAGYSAVFTYTATDGSASSTATADGRARASARLRSTGGTSSPLRPLASAVS